MEKNWKSDFYDFQSQKFLQQIVLIVSTSGGASCFNLWASCWFREIQLFRLTFHDIIDWNIETRNKFIRLYCVVLNGEYF